MIVLVSSPPNIRSILNLVLIFSFSYSLTLFFSSSSTFSVELPNALRILPYSLSDVLLLSFHPQIAKQLLTVLLLVAFKSTAFLQTWEKSLSGCHDSLFGLCISLRNWLMARGVRGPGGSTFISKGSVSAKSGGSILQLFQTFLLL